MHSSVRLWSHDAFCLNGFLLENIIVLLPCIFVIAAKVTSEFLPTGWARSAGSAWAWRISRSAGKMVCLLFKLQVEAKGRFWRRWRDPSTLRDGFHPLVSSLKAAFFFLLRRCRCWLGIYHTDWEQCKILHVCKSWWSVIWVHFSQSVVALKMKCLSSPIAPQACAPEVLIQFLNSFLQIYLWSSWYPAQVFPELVKSLDWKISRTCCFSACIRCVKATRPRPRGRSKVEKHPTESHVGSVTRHWPCPAAGRQLLLCLFERGTSRTLAWLTAKIHVGAQSDWLSAEWTWTWFIVPLWQSPHSCPGHLLLGTRGV